MAGLRREVVGRLRLNKLNALCIAIGAIAAALVTTGAFLAAITVSNMLTFGPISVVSQNVAAPPSSSAVKLTPIQGLPSSVKVDDDYDIEFRIQADEDVNDATLKFQLRTDGVGLNDPNIATVEYRNKDEDDSRRSVPLALLDGKLDGNLKSGWNIPSGFDDTGEVRITFGSNDVSSAPYFIDIWVEGGSTGSGPISSPPPTGGQTFQVQATDDKVFIPQNITISVGDTVKWNNPGGKPHTITFSNTAIPSMEFFKGGQVFEATFNQAGAFSYLCQFHDGMLGTINVIP